MAREAAQSVPCSRLDSKPRNILGRINGSRCGSHTLCFALGNSLLRHLDRMHSEEVEHGYTYTVCEQNPCTQTGQNRTHQHYRRHCCYSCPQKSTAIKTPACTHTTARQVLGCSAALHPDSDYSGTCQEWGIASRPKIEFHLQYALTGRFFRGLPL